ncbi:hypothetical protein [Azospirillum argentinense]
MARVNHGSPFASSGVTPIFNWPTVGEPIFLWQGRGPKR